MQIQVNKVDGKVFLPDSHLARDNDNLIQTFDVTFNDIFIDGIGQLENVSRALSYKNQTNISQIPNDKPFIIDASALGKTN